MSIFHQIESVVAQEMVDEGKLNKIEKSHIPPTAAFNDQDEPALFAVVVPAEHLAEFERRIAQLRA